MISLDVDVFSKAKKYMGKQQDYLLDDVLVLHNLLSTSDKINDYSFLVSPIAKAYEGYLKDFFLKIGLMTQAEFQGDRFRVGKTLNPSLRYKRFSIYQRLSQLDEKGEQLAETLWDAWKKGRNEIFHYFANNTKKLTLDEATSRIHQMLTATISAGKFLENLKILQDSSHV